jgi:hypothetical protein
MALEQVAMQAAPEMIEGFQPLIDLVQPVFLKASILVGGIFGLYLILILVRIHYERKKVKILQDIRYDLDKLNMSRGVKSSRQRKGIFRRIIDKLKKILRNKKMIKEFYHEEEPEEVLERPKKRPIEIKITRNSKKPKVKKKKR